MVTIEGIPDSIRNITSGIERGQESPFNYHFLEFESPEPLLKFSMAPILPADCHKLEHFSLRGLTLRPNRDLLKEDFETRQELHKLLITYLGLLAGSTLTRKIGQLSELEALSPSAHRQVADTAKNTSNFMLEGFVNPILQLITTSMKRAKIARKKIREFTIQNLQPFNLRLALMEGPLLQTALFDKPHVEQAVEIANQRYNDIKRATQSNSHSQKGRTYPQKKNNFQQHRYGGKQNQIQNKAPNNGRGKTNSWGNKKGEWDHKESHRPFRGRGRAPKSSRKSPERNGNSTTKKSSSSNRA